MFCGKNASCTTLARQVTCLVSITAPTGTDTYILNPLLHGSNNNNIHVQKRFEYYSIVVSNLKNNNHSILKLYDNDGGSNTVCHITQSPDIHKTLKIINNQTVFSVFD